MGISVKEASDNLKNRKIDFILKADPSKLGELKKADHSAPFFAGLLVQAAGDAARAEALFEAALDSPSRPVREAALKEVMAFYSRNGHAFSQEEAKLRGQALLRVVRGAKFNNAKKDPSMMALKNLALYNLRRFAEIKPPDFKAGNYWEQAFFFMAAMRTANSLPGALKQAALDFFFRGTPGQAQRWVIAEIGRLEGAGLSPAAPFSKNERGAIDGRLAAIRSDFNAALRAFRPVLEDDPGLFLQYPDMLGDLGRTFQYTNYAERGAGLFLEWIETLPPGIASEEKKGKISLSSQKEEIEKARYMLLYYCGRIKRQLKQYDDAAVFFTQALQCAPDKTQVDACIWYLMDMALLERGNSKAVSLLAQYFPLWNDSAYFSDILERLGRSLAINKEWDSMQRVFELIQNHPDAQGKRAGGSSIAQYAYITGRCVSLGYIEEKPAGGRPSGGQRPGEAYYRAAFSEDSASFYYRGLAAHFLGEKINPVPNVKKQARRGKLALNEKMSFFSGFFRFGCAGYALSYIEPDLKTLEAAELRYLAEALSQAEQWGDSIRVMTELMQRNDYKTERRDMELYYPRPFKELIEANARSEGIPVEIMFGLIRTESVFKSDVLSRAGAVGLTQLMPATAMDAASRIARRGGPNYIQDGKVNLSDPKTNIHLGSWYLRYLTDTIDSPMLGLLAYNGGIGRVRAWRGRESRLPEDLFLETLEYTETRNYGRRVLAAAAAYGYLYYGMTMEAVIADIYKGL